MIANRLVSENIAQYLKTEFIGRKLYGLDTIDSTNSEVKRKSSVEAEGTVVFSEQQTAGRGRLGREWISPKGKGILMSLLLKPDLPPAKIPQLTMIGAAAIFLALENLDASLQDKVRIKWPNDILLGEKKIGGILTEMQANGDRVQSVVIGIGLNVSLQAADFPEELVMKATSLFLATGKVYERERLMAEILNCFEPLYLKFLKGATKEFLAICRQRSAVIGKKVFLTEKGEGHEVEVLDLGPQGELIVKMANGKISSIISGEISLSFSS